MKKFKAEFEFGGYIPRLCSLREMVAFIRDVSRESYLRPGMYGFIPSVYRAWLTANLLCLERGLKIAIPEYSFDLTGEFTATAFLDFPDMAEKHGSLLLKNESAYPLDALPEVPTERLADGILAVLREAYSHPAWHVSPERFTRDREDCLPQYPFYFLCELLLQYWTSLHDNYPEYDDFEMDYVFLPRSNARFHQVCLLPNGDDSTHLKILAPIISSTEQRLAQISAYYAWRKSRSVPLLISGTWVGKSRSPVWDGIRLEFSEDSGLHLASIRELHWIPQKENYIFTDDHTIRTSLCVHDYNRQLSFGSEGMQIVLHYTLEKMTFTDFNNRTVTFYPEAKP